MSIMSQEAKKQLGCVLHWSGGPSSSNAPKQITPYGDVKQLLPFTGAGIGMFNGNGDYLSYPVPTNENLWDSNFTIEVWISFTDATAGVTKPLFMQYYDSNNYVQALYWYSANGITFEATVGGVNKGYYYAAFTPTVGQLYHIVIERSASSCLIFVNGMSQSVTVNNAFTTMGAINGEYRICRGGTTAYFNGYLSELRISNVARYTANFTPPKRQLESDSNTKLLLHFNRNDTTFIDSSPSAHTITAYGDAKQLCSPCGSGVAYFDGNGDYLETWAMSNTNNNICIETWLKSNVNSTNQIFFQHGWPDSVNGSLAMRIGINSSNQLYYQYNPDISWTWITVTSSTARNWYSSWNHIRFVRVGTTAYLFVNGVLDFTGHVPVNAGCLNSCMYAAIGFGHTNNASQVYFNGYLSEFLITKNPVYFTTTGFTTSPTRLKSDIYTKALYHMDGVGNAFYDSSDPPGDNGFPILPDGVNVTPNGTFAVKKMKDGRNIWAFNGSNNYITFGANNNLTYFGTNDFTLCAWVYSSVFNSKTMRIFGISDYFAANVWWSFGVGYNAGWGSNAINIAVTTGYSTYADIIAANVLTNNTWNHVVFVVRNGSPEMYCNGSRCTITKNTVSANWSYNAVSSLYIGNSRSNVSELMDGCIKDAMIFKKALTQDQIAAIMAETYIY